MTPLSPSSEVAPSSAWAQRLAQQLQLISEVTETLTYRLLELEERLAEGERELEALREESRGATATSPAMESWLEETEERLGRVEELLRRGESRTLTGSGGSVRPLMAVQPAGTSAATDPDRQEGDPDPFPEEGEQPFLDEQSA